ncbi:hypothetical protein IPL85_00660 [Candidatus Saccharibacteria bacterium]|nr:MAG: hypothetical protein IPL85_00660 [Candidatus Saccharibacteria bacterium]
MKRKKHMLAWLSLTALFFGVLFQASVAFAQCATNPDQQACSGNQYGVSETFFGTGGELNACSGNQYCAKQSAGELTVGNTKGTAYQAQAGFNTDRTPWLEIDLTKAGVNLGDISPSTTGYDYATFTVKSYLAHGYVVQIHGSAPTNAGHEITPLSVASTIATGTEQFGLNLRNNATPNVGADPVQQPDGTFSFGTYAATYGTADNFKYVDGDVIAESLSSSGYTDYTISYIMNVTEITPGGTYTTNQSLVATSTF